MDNTTILTIVIIACVLISLMIFFASGMFYVKENYAYVIESLYRYKIVLYHGLHFQIPFLDRCVGRYNISENRIKIMKETDDIYITYKINDVKKFHYQMINQNENINDIICKKINSINTGYKEELETICNTFGLILINIVINKR